MKKTDKTNKTDRMDTVATSIANKLLRWQKRGTGYLNQKFEGVGAQSLRIGLIIFCFLGCGCSLYVIVEAILENDNGGLQKITPLRIPILRSEYESVPYAMEPVVSDDEYQQLQGFKKYMDSLQKVPAGKKLYDSLLRARPGMMDSVGMLEKIYLSKKQRR